MQQFGSGGIELREKRTARGPARGNCVARARRICRFASTGDVYVAGAIERDRIRRVGSRAAPETGPERGAERRKLYGERIARGIGIGEFESWVCVLGLKRAGGSWEIGRRSSARNIGVARGIERNRIRDVRPGAAPVSGKQSFTGRVEF